MNDWVYINGQYVPASQARISVFDRGFLFADSVYEVIAFYGGQGFRLEEHLARLERSLEAVDIRLQMPWSSLCETLVARNGGGDQAVYLQVTRGNEGCRNHRYGPDLKPTVVAFSYAIPAALEGDPERVAGISAALVEDIRWQRCDIKSTALLGNVMVLQEALARGAQEALLVRDGFLTEGSASNLFLVREGVLMTPPRGPFILGGTTRDLVLELAADIGIPTRETELPREALDSAEEIWITSSTRGVVPVFSVDGKTVGEGGKGPLWQRMARRFCRFEAEVRGQNSESSSGEGASS